jgi:hypothetical protein
MTTVSSSDITTIVMVDFATAAAKLPMSAELVF